MKDKILKLIKDYKNHLRTNGNEDEVYKWRAIMHFQDHWNFEAPDFYDMFKEALSKRENLMFLNSYGFLNTLGKKYPEKLKSLFALILNEESGFQAIYNTSRKFADECLIDLKQVLNRDNIQHQLDERTISFLRVLNDPENEYLYKANVYYSLCDYLEIDKISIAGEKYDHFAELGDSFITYINDDRELLDLCEGYIPMDFKFDSTKLIFQDIVYNMLVSLPSSIDNKKFMTRLFNDIKEELESEEHPLMDHVWIDNDTESYRQVSIIPDISKVSTDDIHYELYRYTNQMCFEVHPEGSLEFKRSVKELIDGLPNVQNGLKLAKWHTGIGDKNIDKGQHSKLVPKTKIPYSLRQTDYEKLKAELIDQFKNLYQEFNEPFLNYLNMNKEKDTNLKLDFARWIVDNPRVNYFNNRLSRIVVALDSYNDFFDYDIYTCNSSNWKELKSKIKDIIYDKDTDFFKFSETNDSHKPRAILGRDNYFKFLKEKFENDLFRNDEEYSGYNPVINQIFYGPPGTGKTYHTILEAAKIVSQDVTLTYDRALDVFNEHLGSSIEFITFHQNYSYEDFIQGLRPDIDQKELSFNRADGVFSKMSTNALFEYYKLYHKDQKRIKADQDSKIDLNDAYIEFVGSLEENQKFETKTGKTIRITNFTDKQNIEFRPIEGVKSYVVSSNRLLKLYKAYPDINSITRVHEDIRGVIGGCNSTIYYVALREFIAFVDNYKATVDDYEDPDVEDYDYEDISLKRKKELLQNFDLTDLRRVKTKRVPKYVIIIDEINRANISRVFGELITLIEKDKRSHGNIPITATLPSGEKFIVPSNLYIIGTMNTADKSIALLDIALRRRFEFVPMYPKYQLENDLEIFDADILERINKEIIIKKGHDFTIGHSYFMGDDYELKNTIDNKVIPLLLEYFMNDCDEVKKILQAAELDIDGWPMTLKLNG